jgi:alpha-N-arabinofuranosidase
VLTPTYHVMEMYNIHQNAKLLPITLKTDDYQFGDQKLPAVSASASKDSSGFIHLSITNINSEKLENISIKIEGENCKKVTGRILTSPGIHDHNTFDDPHKIEPKIFTGASLKNDVISLAIPPFSLVVLEVK